MKVEKAIEILGDLELTDSLDLEPDEKDAILLGIQALKCIQVLRIIPDKRLNLTLPGETED